MLGIALSLHALLAAATSPSPSAAGCAWPEWEAYARTYISDDGRVIDRADSRTTSEGQAYALFFALVANDRPRFERILEWTRDNLAGGDLARQLPSWHWGRRRDGSWGVIDPNAASDADLWIAYALLEAGRLWHAPEHAALGARMLDNVWAREVKELPGLGPTLLPAPNGFELKKGARWRLNPSYLPLQLLRRFSSPELMGGRWGRVADSSARVLSESAAHGFAPDWIVWEKGRFRADPISGARGGYDAIRVYLWAGMLSGDDPLRAEILERISGPLRHFQKFGVVPERVELTQGRVLSDHAPTGFYAALLPAASDTAPDAARILARVVASARRDAQGGATAAYYDQNLALFAEGFVAGRYRFDPKGALVVRWEAPWEGR